MDELAHLHRTAALAAAALSRALVPFRSGAGALVVFGEGGAHLGSEAMAL